MNSNLNISFINKSENKCFQPKQIIPEEEADEISQVNELNFSFDDDIELESFLSKKFDGLNELNNLLDNVEENKIDQNIEKENNKNINGSEEILEIIKRAWGDKTYRFQNSPFKRLIKPKKFSLEGRILLNFRDN